jgi:hypothetical protein
VNLLPYIVQNALFQQTNRPFVFDTVISSPEVVLDLDGGAKK